MDNEQKVDLVWERFIHRDDVFARQWYEVDDKGQGRMGYARQTEGHCPMRPPCPKRQCPHITNQKLTKKTVLSHLKGEQTLGVYQLADDNTVKWLCLDVDIAKNAPADLDLDVLKESAKQHTLTLATAITKMCGRGTVLVERSGSKGWHLWVFFSEPVAAKYVHALGNWLDHKNAPPTGINVEVFPKQVQTNNLGNLVKLPLGFHRKTMARCFFVNARFEDHPDQWSVLANVKVLTPAELSAILASNKVEVINSIRIEPSGESGKGGFPCMTRIMSEGLGDGQRDVGMFRLANYLRDRGLPHDAATLVIHHVNEKSSPPLDEYTVQQKLDNAYISDYSPFPCGESSLDAFCSSNCRFWQGKVRERWSRYNKPAAEAVGIISRD